MRLFFDATEDEEGVKNAESDAYLCRLSSYIVLINFIYCQECKSLEYIVAFVYSALHKEVCPCSR